MNAMIHNELCVGEYIKNLYLKSHNHFFLLKD